MLPNTKIIKGQLYLLQNGKYVPAINTASKGTTTKTNSKYFYHIWYVNLGMEEFVTDTSPKAALEKAIRTKYGTNVSVHIQECNLNNSVINPSVLVDTYKNKKEFMNKLRLRRNSYIVAIR